MTVDHSRAEVWSELVTALLAARSDPATDGFDDELASAVAAGQLGPEAARRLRSWQRASVRAADEHARTVLPAALGALEEARRDARAASEALTTALSFAASRPTTAAEQAAGRTGPAGAPGPAASEPQGADAAVEVARRASDTAGDRPATLEPPAPRLFVADLRDAVPSDRT